MNKWVGIGLALMLVGSVGAAVGLRDEGKPSLPPRTFAGRSNLGFSVEQYLC